MTLRNSFWTLVFCISIVSTQAQDSQEHPLVDSRPLFEGKVVDITYQQYKGTHFGTQNDSEDEEAQSGYEALASGLSSWKLPRVSEGEKVALLQRVHDQSAHKLFAQENSSWRSQVIEYRRRSSLSNYLTTCYLIGLISEMNKIDLMEDTKKRSSEQSEIEALVICIGSASERIIKTHSPLIQPFTITPHDMYQALEEVARVKLPGLPFDRSICEKHLSKAVTITGKLRSSVNRNEIFTDDKLVHQEQYGPKDSTLSLDGSWLSSSDLTHILERELNEPSTYFADLKTPANSVYFLEFSKNPTQAERLFNDATWKKVKAQLEKKSTESTALFLINFDTEWVSCIMTVDRRNISFTVIDPSNKDRRQEPGMISLAQFVKALVSPASQTVPTPTKKQDQAVGPNYDAPLAFLPDSEIPTLQDLFGDTIPNTFRLYLKHMQNRSTKQPSGMKPKNCLLLYGPPGTGKSTIAQVMARTAGKNIVYAGGGDFRDEFQGSGKAKLDALFAEAKKRGNCVIIIDEIDGTSSRMQPVGSTQEDNRALKSLITTLDQYRYDPDIFVICTTNYVENIDPAITRRFKAIEIPLPNYTQRKKIIDYYLARNGITVLSKTPDAISPDFYDKLISATEGFSGDNIGEMINNGVFEYREKLQPEHYISLNFRTKGVDLQNKSILANLGELALLPLTPLFMLIGESDLDKHIYSSYLQQVKLQIPDPRFDSGCRLHQFGDLFP
jgi:hypothetical protein